MREPKTFGKKLTTWQVFVRSNRGAEYCAALLTALAAQETQRFAVSRVAGLPVMTAARRKSVISAWAEDCEACGGGCLVNVQAIATGFDMPAISDVFIGRAGALRPLLSCLAVVSKSALRTLHG